MPYPTYKKYKDSGVSWLGEVPEHWDVMPLRRLVSTVKTGTTPTGVNEYHFDDDGLSWFRPSDFSDVVTLNNAEKKLSLEGISEVKVFPENTVMHIGIGATIGKVGLTTTVSSCNQQINAIICNEKLIPLFAVYNFHLLRDYIVRCGKYTTLPIINQDETKALIFCTPPLEEQQTIANFLDHKTRQIDALIAKKETLLEKLAEKRTALISNAVTKGLNPKAKMKDSGVEWLGEVPEHWEVKRLKFVVNLVNEKIEATLSDLNYMGLEHIESWTGNKIEDDMASSEGIASRFIPNDVLFGKLRPYLAKVYLANHEGIASTEALILRSSNVVNARFLRYYMVSREFINIVNGSTFGSKMPRASWEFIGNLPMLLPNMAEQEKIADIIDRKINEVEIMKANTQQAINKLKEYRSALITNAVTGKIDVRHHASHPTGSTGKPSLSKSAILPICDVRGVVTPALAAKGT